MEGIVKINAPVSLNHLCEVSQSHFLGENTIFSDDFAEIRLTVFHDEVKSFIVFDGVN